MIHSSARDSITVQTEQVLIEKYDRLYRLAYSYVYNEDDALDIVQESACKAIIQCKKLKDTTKLLPWLCRIVVNKNACEMHTFTVSEFTEILRLEQIRIQREKVSYHYYWINHHLKCKRQPVYCCCAFHLYYSPSISTFWCRLVTSTPVITIRGFPHGLKKLQTVKTQDINILRQLRRNAPWSRA